MSQPLAHVQGHTQDDPGEARPEHTIRMSLIIPAHNEQARLVSTLRAYSAGLTKVYGQEAELIVIANGCRDRTADIARLLSVKSPVIRVVEIPEPVGKGGAILEGFRQALGSAVVFADADGSTSIESLIGLVNALDCHDLVIGSRHLSTSVITRRQPLFRRCLGAAFRTTQRLLLGLPYSDPQCGAKALRRSACERLLAVVSETHWMFYSIS